MGNTLYLTANQNTWIFFWATLKLRIKETIHLKTLRNGVFRQLTPLFFIPFKQRTLVFVRDSFWNLFGSKPPEGLTPRNIQVAKNTD